MIPKHAIQTAAHILELWLPQKMMIEAIPGLSIGIVHKGELIFKTGYGFADIENNSKATFETCYPIASISKTFTAFAIFQLIEAGKLKLTDRVEKILPWFKDDKGKFKKITIKNLLEHSSGLWRDGNTYHWYNDQFPSEAELQQSLEDTAQKISINTRFKYSNYGYALLGLIIKKVSGESYESYIQNNICKRLGMTSTTAYPHEEIIGRLAHGYGKFVPGKTREKFSKFVPALAYDAATGLVSNVADLAKFLGTFSKKSDGLISAKSFAMMTKPLHSTEDGDKYGMGMDIIPLGKRKILGHSGGYSGYTLDMGYELTSDIGVIILTNAIGVKAQGLVLGVFDMIFRLMTDAKFKRVTPSEPNSNEGYYSSRWSDEVVVALGKRYALLGLWNNFPLKFADYLEPMKNDTYRVRSSASFAMHGEIAKFTKDKEGKQILDYGSAITYKMS